MRVVSRRGMLNGRLFRQIGHFLQYYEASNLSCGIVLAVCPKIGEAEQEELKRCVADVNPAVAAKLFYDDETGLLALLLEDCRLSDAHYIALAVKELAAGRGWLESDILVAGFPESAPSVQQLVDGVGREIADWPEGRGDIRIYHERAGEARTHKLLVVDSDGMTAQFLTTRLGMKGYQVHVARDGREGLQKFRELAPDVVITELDLPIVDGYQLMEVIRGEAVPGTCRVLVLTDRRLEDDIRKCFACGAADYMTKPFSPVELEVRIKRLLNEPSLTCGRGE